MGFWGSWVLLGFPGLGSLCCAVGVSGARLALVCRVVWVVPVGEMVSVGWGATMPVGIMVWGVMGASIGWRVVQAAAMAGRGAWGVLSETAASVTVGIGARLRPDECLLCLGPSRSVIWSFSCWCINVLNEICHGGMAFLIEESYGCSPRQSGQIHYSYNTGHQSSGGQNDLFVHKQNIYYHRSSYWL